MNGPQTTDRHPAWGGSPHQLNLLFALLEQGLRLLAAGQCSQLLELNIPVHTSAGLGAQAHDDEIPFRAHEDVLSQMADGRVVV